MRICKHSAPPGMVFTNQCVTDALQYSVRTDRCPQLVCNIKEFKHFIYVRTVQLKGNLIHAGILHACFFLVACARVCVCTHARTPKYNCTR